MRTDEELYTVAHEACSLDEHPPDVSCGAHRRRAVYDLGRADERARLAGEGPTDAEFLSIADQISAGWVKEHPSGATHNDRPLDKLIVRAIADLAAAHMAARFEARVAELEAAAAAMFEAALKKRDA